VPPNPGELCGPIADPANVGNAFDGGPFYAMAPDGSASLQSLGVRHIVIDENRKYYGTEPPLLRR
jgi:hypothetical protein